VLINAGKAEVVPVLQGAQGGEVDAEPCRVSRGSDAELKTEVTLGMVFWAFSWLL
jgi:hypothetical protein